VVLYDMSVFHSTYSARGSTPLCALCQGVIHGLARSTATILQLARLTVSVAIAHRPTLAPTLRISSTLSLRTATAIMRDDDRYPALRAWLEQSDESYHLDVPTEEVRASLIAWYETNRRRLPWRGDAPPYNGSTAGINSASAAASTAAAAGSPQAPQAAQPVSTYGVWVSEIMCQQTRVEAVIPYWLAWMEAFPTVEALAAASEEDVNAKWAGLGFYRRARFLHEGSRQVVNEHGGQLPTTVDGLLRIKGIGRYTAGAIASISAGVAAPIVDGNVLRVLSRLCAISASAKEPAFCADGKLAWRLAQQLVEAGGGERAGDFNQALMECGATLCAPGGSGTDARDPLRPFYRSTQIGRDAHRAHKAGELEDLLDAAAAAAADGRGVFSRAACKQGATEFMEGLRTAAAAESEEAAAAAVHALLPLAPRKKARREERLAMLALHRSAGGEGEGGAAGDGPSAASRWLLVKRPADGLLANQWEFPHATVASHPDELPDDPGKRARAEAIDALLVAAGVADDEGGGGGVARTALPDTVEHIFSHVRHTMHIEHAAAAAAAPADADATTTGKPWTRRGRTYCWMGEERMAQVGVTAGVKKVIAAVLASAKPGGGKAAAKGKPAAKRKAAAAAATDAAEAPQQQKKLSAFFAKKSE